MTINERMKQIIKSEGRTQKWILEEMNRTDPQLNLNPAIFSAIITGKRGVTGDELLAFCKVTGKNPNIFMQPGA